MLIDGIKDKFEELIINYYLFDKQENNNAGKRVRRNAQDLRRMLKDLREEISTVAQARTKERKEIRESAKKETNA
jgi:hypothetical protein